jgi:hypothetical protein
MDYRIAQDQQYVGGDYWNWSAWIEASPDSLAQIDHVTWLLHPSFTPSRVESRSADSKFRLDSSGWGTFRLRAEVHTKAGDSIAVSRMLKLTYPDEAESASSNLAPVRGSASSTPNLSLPYVYMSYSSEDANQALRVRNTMEELGVQVRDAREVEPGLPLDAAIRKMIRESAGVMTVLGSDYASPFVISEMKLAAAEEKPTLALLPTNTELPYGLLSNIHELRFGEDPKEIAPMLADFASKIRLDEGT